MLREETLALVLGRQLLKILDLEDENTTLRFRVEQVNEPHEPEEPVSPDSVAPTSNGTHYEDYFEMNPEMLNTILGKHFESK
jgi:hypothetical protein